MRAFLMALCLMAGSFVVVTDVRADESECTGQNLGDPDGDGWDSYKTGNPLYFCGDCNPYDAYIHPMADDWMDGKDDDCDGLVDEDGIMKGKLVGGGCSQCKLQGGGGCCTANPPFTPLALLALFFLRRKRTGGQR